MENPSSRSRRRATGSALRHLALAALAAVLGTGIASAHARPKRVVEPGQALVRLAPGTSAADARVALAADGLTIASEPDRNGWVLVTGPASAEALIAKTTRNGRLQQPEKNY